MNFHNGVTGRYFGLVVLASTIVVAAGATAQAQGEGKGVEEHPCTQATLQGDYGYSFSGPDAAAKTLKVSAAVGVMTFDGAGGLSARDTRTADGPVSRRTGTGTYSVGVDNFPANSRATCMGSATLGGDFAGLSFDFMIVPGSKGQEFSLVITSPNTAQTGIGLRTGNEPCSDASLEGTYRVQSAGISLKNVPFAAVGFRVLDGAGNLTWAEDTTNTTTNATKAPHRIGRAATYQVLSDCTVTEVFTDGATFEGVVVAGGDEAYLIRTGPGDTGPIPVFYKHW